MSEPGGGKTPTGAARLQAALTLALVAGATLFVIWNLRPGLWFEANTPTGGDLGAHVWSPAYLRDVPLPAGRLTGWSPDWYAGFPAFSFYMVIPSLLIVIVDVGLPLWLLIPTLALIAAATALLLIRLRPGRARSAWIVGSAVGMAILATGVDYGVAIKLVVVAGMVALPAAAYAAGRLGGIAFPGPAVMAVMTLPFLFDRSFNIYGGNLMSTMAGEFAYSLGLALAVLYAGVVARGLETGRQRGSAAVLLALAGLTHLFAAFLALAFTAALLITRPGVRNAQWVALTGAVAAAISAFWVLPFAWNRSLLNDMGWGKERRYTEGLWNRAGEFGDQTFLANDPPLQVFVVLACVGAVVFSVRRMRFGMALAITAAGFALAFLYLPEGRLWNVRLLPFYYLCVYLLAGLTVAEIGRWFARSLAYAFDRRSALWLPAAAAAPSIVGALVLMVALGLPLRSLPGGSLDEATGRYSWLGLSTTELNLGPHWVTHNFNGYEGAAAWGEYSAMVAAMERVGTEHGCGRALWEYESQRLGAYGTPMSPMLLPYWTDGCIGSMEGLYFEASATTPYHFLLQSELSAQPSRAQRDLPYSDLNVADGVGHLQDLGVRYYMAFSETAVAQARAEPRLREIESAGPWVVFAVSDSDPVVALDHLPVVIDGIGAGGEDWLVPTVAHWEADDVPLLAADGPDSWPSMTLQELELLAMSAGGALEAIELPEPLAADEMDRFDEILEAMETADDEEFERLLAELDELEGITSPDDLDAFPDPLDPASGDAAAGDLAAGDPVAGQDVPDMPQDRVSRMRRLAEALPAVLPRTPVTPVEVSDVELDRFSISFEVDEPGRPVLVRTSWFPNWSVSGADGPYRVAPNLIAVVPTDNSVTLRFGRSAVEMVGIVLSVLGIAALFVIGGVRPARRERRLWDFISEPLPVDGLSELRLAASEGTLDADHVARLDRSARLGTLRVLLVGGLGLAVVLIVGVAVAVRGAPTDAPVASLALLAPGLVALGALLFWAVPRYLHWRHYRLGVIRPARMLLELGEGPEAEARIRPPAEPADRDDA